MLVIVSERLLFIIPAHQNRPLQVLEISLVLNMEYYRSNGMLRGDGSTDENVELQIQLRNTGFYILNGVKGAIDQVYLVFATNHDCDGFCQALAEFLQNIPSGLLHPVGGQFDLERDQSMPRPKKQSRAVMIDLSQGDNGSGEPQRSSPPLRARQRVSKSGRIDVSRSRESSMSPIASVRETTQDAMTPVQPKENEASLLNGSQCVQQEMHDGNKAEVKRKPDDGEKPGAVHSVGRASELDKLPEESVALSHPDSTSQDTVPAQATEGPLLQQKHHHDFAELRMNSPVAILNLQRLALDALQESVEHPSRATPGNSDLVVSLEQHNHDSSAALSTPPLPLANSAQKMGTKLKSAKQAIATIVTNAQRQNEAAKSEISRKPLRQSTPKNATSASDVAVDWDEDLRTDQSKDKSKDQARVAKASRASAIRSARTGPRKPAATKTARRRKGTPKDAIKEKMTKRASGNAGIAATRPRRAAANVSYDERSDLEKQSQNTVPETKDLVALHAETNQISVETPSVNKGTGQILRKMHSANDQAPVDVIDGHIAEPQHPLPPTTAAVEIACSIDALPTAVEPQTEPGKKDAEDFAPGPDKESFHGQKGQKANPDHERSEGTGMPDAEVVNDSYPMDKQRHANALSAARKSFGSALMDIINESGRQPIETSHVIVSRTKPFGDKAAFVDSVKSALNKSPKRLETPTPRSDRMKHLGKSSTGTHEGSSAARQRPANDILQSAPRRNRTPLEMSSSHQRGEERVEMTPPLKIANVATSTATSKGPHIPGEPLSIPQQRRSDIGQTSSPKKDEQKDNDNYALLSSCPHMLTKPKLSPKTDDSAPIFPFSAKAARIYHKKRERDPDAKDEKPPQVKRARNHDADLDTDQIDDKLMQSSTTSPRHIVNTTDGPSTKQRSSEPLAQELDASAVLRMRQIQKTAQTGGCQREQTGTRSPETASNPIRSAAQAPSPRVVRASNLPMLTDGHPHRETQNSGFSVRSPRKQGGLSSAERRGQGSSVPTETGKHLAFKNLHAGSKAVEYAGKAIRHPFRLFGDDTKRKVQFSFSDGESTGNEIDVDEESADDTGPASAITEHDYGKSASQTSKVDENGSPRLHPRKTARVSHPSNGSTTLDDCRGPQGRADTTSVIESSEIEGLESKESGYFGLEAAIFDYTAENAPMAAKSRDIRSRPSIGVGKLLDHSFPQASKSIETDVFKAPIRANNVASMREPCHVRSLDQMVMSQCPPGENIPISHAETPPLFDIDQLSVSAAPEHLASAASAHVRRLRSSTPQSPNAEAPEPIASPLSFNTRLGKMVMPPPPKKEQSKMGYTNDFRTSLYVRQEQSAMMDAETTLVNGETFDEETNLSSPDRRRQSSSSSSDEKEGAPVSALQQVPAHALHGDRIFWNHKVAETQQTVAEILNQVSQVGTSF